MQWHEGSIRGELISSQPTPRIRIVFGRLPIGPRPVGHCSHRRAPFEKLDAFFLKRKGFFPEKVMRDESRELFMRYRVNGIPTFVLVEQGRIKNT